MFLTAVAVVAVVIALVVLGIRPSSSAGPAADAAQPTTAPPAGLTLTSPSSARLAVGATPYTLEVGAKSPCWVQVRSGTRVLFAGTLSSGQNHTLQLQGPAEVELGSSGGSLALTFGGHHFNLVPPAAPYTYSLS